MGTTTAQKKLFFNLKKIKNQISAGNVDELKNELPNLRTFATLSPVPGFRPWLDGFLAENDVAPWTLVQDGALAETASVGSGREALHILLARDDWHYDEAAAEALRSVLEPLVAQYLLNEKRGKWALDPVENFLGPICYHRFAFGLESGYRNQADDGFSNVHGCGHPFFELGPFYTRASTRQRCAGCTGGHAHATSVSGDRTARVRSDGFYDRVPACDIRRLCCGG